MTTTPFDDRISRAEEALKMVRMRLDALKLARDRFRASVERRDDAQVFEAELHSL